MPKIQGFEITVILNDIRSSENVGSIFRTCDAAGAKKIILCGYTPAPLDRFGRENKALTKASLGAEKFVEWEKAESLKSASLKVRKEGYKIIGVEQNKNSIDYRALKSSKLLPACAPPARAGRRASSPARHDGVSGGSKLAVVFGNEVDGLSEEDLSLCDVVVEIPMRGKKESLNVSVAAGIVLFELLA